MELILVAAGLVALLFGGELVVRGASRLAALLGISPLIIGLTVVNIVGSNTYNVLGVLGLSAIVAPLLVQQQLIRLDVPLMIGASLLFWAVALDGVVSFAEGGLMFGLLIVYLVIVVRVSRGESAEIAAEYEQEYGYRPGRNARQPLVNVALVVGGAVLLVAGAALLVDGAVGLARSLGVSDLLIGLTVVALGTSLPELTTSVVAALRGERDIAVGNVVGSNIFNILSVLGLTAIIAPAGIVVSPTALAVDLPFMVAVAVACLPLFATGRVIGRLEGAFLLAYGAGYTAFIVAVAYGFNLPPVAFAGLLLIAPIAILTLLAYRHPRADRGRRG